MICVSEIDTGVLLYRKLSHLNNRINVMLRAPPIESSLKEELNGESDLKPSLCMWQTVHVINGVAGE